MGFLTPQMPVIDVEEWRKGTRADRVRPMVRHLAETGMGTPYVIHVMYLIKICLYVLGGWLVAIGTTGIDGFTNVTAWYTEPIVFEKVVLYTMLFEVVGLGCGFGPLNTRLFPPMGSIFYWLRPATIRLPPWPNRVPLTRGDARALPDVVLYGALLVLLLTSLFTDGTGPIPALHTNIGVLPAWQIWSILGVLAVLGLRDKIIFLAARGEVYASLTVTFLFTGVDMIVAAKVVMLIIWVGAATSKLNKHLPFVMSAMLANSPVIGPRALKHRLFQDFPTDLRPGPLARGWAHFSTAIEMLVPLVLFFCHGGWPTVIAAFIMVCFHTGIISSIPAGVPLEWNVFMIYGVLTLFVGHSAVGLRDIANPWPVALLFLTVAGTVVMGNLFPHKVSFLPGMRYYAGNWDTSWWCITASGQQKLDTRLVAYRGVDTPPIAQYGEASREVTNHLGYAFRGLNTHGRALFTLARRAVAGQPEDNYVITDGEVVCGYAVGWNFGDGHMHNEQLIAALQRRCHFEPGEVRVVLLDAQPIHKQTQQYRLVDAATGEFERGHVRIVDLTTRQPWADDVPVFLHNASHRSSGR